MARAYWDFRDQLSTDKGLLLMGPGIVIPSCLWEEYLEKLHQGHLSATKVQQNAHQHLYWPGLDTDIIDYMRRCQECIHQSLPPKEPLQAHDEPQQPWECKTMDYFYVNSRLYVLVYDYFSKFPFVFQTRTTSFSNLRNHLQELFAVEGTPDEIMSDNGSPFNGKSSVLFLWVLVSDTPSHNQTTKRLMEKATSTGRNFEEALTSLRAQLLGDGLPSKSRDTSWDEFCNKKGNSSGCSCSLSVSNCFTDQIHQEL